MAKRKAKVGKPIAKLTFNVCQWFLLCGRPATGTTPHPILSDVPTCDRCHKFATGKER